MTITVATNIKTVSPIFIFSPPYMLEKITSKCYVSYHIRSGNKNQLKIQKILCIMSENLTCVNLIRMKSTYAIRSDNWYNILTIKNMGDACGENTY
ncbi:hypothetical protein BCM0060_1064 [Bacillus cereus]|nr:hypothetical protein BCM0060_1064 [Bacillus cereus]